MKLNEQGKKLLREWESKYRNENPDNNPELGTEILDHLVTDLASECGWMVLTYNNGPYGNDALSMCEEWLVYGDYVVRGEGGYTVSQLQNALKQYFE
jgi:hypothetical protein